MPCQQAGHSDSLPAATVVPKKILSKDIHKLLLYRYLSPYAEKRPFYPFKSSQARVVVHPTGEGLFLVRSVNLRNPG